MPRRLKEGMFGRAAMERRLGLQDARGPQGMFSRGANVYRGGLPMAQAGVGNPNMGRPPNQASAQPPGQPSTQGVTNAAYGVAPTPTSLAGSLPPNAGTSSLTMNNAVIDLLRRQLARRTANG